MLSEVDCININNIRMLQIDAVAITMIGMFSPVTGTQSRSAVGSAVAIHDYGGQP